MFCRKLVAIEMLSDAVKQIGRTLLDCSSSNTANHASGFGKYPATKLCSSASARAEASLLEWPEGELACEAGSFWALVLYSARPRAIKLIY
jgi:hypothetical protein